MDYGKIIEEISADINPADPKGELASYIPELRNVDPDKFGIHLSCLNGDSFSTGDTEDRFSMQSITKVFSLAMAMLHKGDKIFDRVDVEPSGTSFNSMVLLEYEHGIPRNPFINSGALVIADILVEVLNNPKEDFLQFVRKMADDDSIRYNLAVADSESKTGFRNEATANMLKSYGNIKNEVEQVLDFYYHQCSLEMSCHQLAQAFLVFANSGKLMNGEQFISQQQSQRINALMQTCGFYDEAGEFAFRVGLPGKSGVGGGIAAVYPGKYSVAVWSPRLNEQGNSVLGMEALEHLTTRTGMAIF